MVDVKCVSSSHCTCSSSCRLLNTTLQNTTPFGGRARNGRRTAFSTPISTNQTTPHNETRPTTPVPTAEEGSLSPAWNPSSSLPCDSNRPTTNDAVLSTEGGPLTEDFSVPCHWTQDIRMTAIGDLKVRVIVDGRECRGSLIRLGNRMQLRLLRGGIIEPHRILPRHPRRETSMAHCG